MRAVNLLCVIFMRRKVPWSRSRSLGFYGNGGQVYGGANGFLCAKERQSWTIPFQSKYFRPGCQRRCAGVQGYCGSSRQLCDCWSRWRLLPGHSRRAECTEPRCIASSHPAVADVRSQWSRSGRCHWHHGGRNGADRRRRCGRTAERGGEQTSIRMALGRPCICVWAVGRDAAGHHHLGCACACLCLVDLAGSGAPQCGLIL